MYERVCIEDVVRHNFELCTIKFDRQIGEPEPGQFAMFCIPGLNEKPFSFSGPREIIVKKRGEFTSCLFEMKKGDSIYLRGPLGKSFPYTQIETGIAGGCGIGPVVFSAKKGKMEKILYGARTSESFAEDSIFQEIEVVYATDDGSRGYHGFVTDLIEGHVLEPDSDVFICGPESMMKKSFQILSENIRVYKNPNYFFSLERYMKCGIGLCGECSCSGYRVCVDGPVFSFKQLLDMPDFGVSKRKKSGQRVMLFDNN